jgi:hypothetical protein
MLSITEHSEEIQSPGDTRKRDPLKCRRWRHAISPAVVQEGPGYLCETCYESGATTNRQFRKLFGWNFHGTARMSRGR